MLPMYALLRVHSILLPEAEGVHLYKKPWRKESPETPLLSGAGSVTPEFSLA